MRTTMKPLFSDRRDHVSPGTAAFTLLEIVVAVAVLGVGLAAVLHSFSVSARGLEGIRSLTTATNLAQAKMTELEETPEIEKGESSGDFGEEFPGYSWEAETASVDEEELFFRIKVRVNGYRGDTKRNILEVSTIRVVEKEEEQAVVPDEGQ